MDYCYNMDITIRSKQKRKMNSSNDEAEYVTPKKHQKVNINKELTTNQKRALKKINQKQRTQSCRENMSETQKEIVRNKNRLRMQKSRKKETTLEQKTSNKAKNKKLNQKQRTQSCRENMTDTQKEIARNKNRQRMQISRKKETTLEQKASNKAINKKRKEIANAALTPGQIAHKKDIDRNRKKASNISCIKNFTPKSAYFDEQVIQYHNIGLMSFICSACKARMFEAELHNKKNAYSLCCNYGKVKIPAIKPPPQELRNLFTHEDDISKEFRKNIRMYNSSLALASVGIDLGTTFKFDNRGP